MKNEVIAERLVRLAKDLIGDEKVKVARDADLDAIAEVVENGSFLSLRSGLKVIGMKKVDFQYDPEAHWTMKTRRGKTVVIINKKYADAGPGDIVVGSFVVGYM